MEMELKTSFDYGTIQGAEGFEAEIRRCIQAALLSEDFPYNAEIEINWVTPDEIREMNQSLRGVDRVTDVLSVPFLEAEDGTLYVDDSDFYEDFVQLGEIIICYDRALQQAGEYGHSMLREVCFLAVHSVLHLLGYDHELGEAEEQEMFAKQEAVLQSLGIVR